MQRSIESVRSSLGPEHHLIAAVDDIKSMEHIQSFAPDVEVIMTPPECPSGTDRVFEAAKHYVERNKIDPKNLRVVNVQGDMPFVTSETINSFLNKLSSLNEEYVTLAAPWPESYSADDASKVKCVVDLHCHALYFSRSPIPYDSQKRLLHLGVYAYSFGFLKIFCELQPSFLEKAERLEQLRALENSKKLYVVVDPNLCVDDFHGIDTPADLQWARNRIKH